MSALDVLSPSSKSVVFVIRAAESPPHVLDLELFTCCHQTAGGARYVLNSIQSVQHSGRHQDSPHRTGMVTINCLVVYATYCTEYYEVQIYCLRFV